MEIKEIQVESILTPSKLPDADYVINPYTGCAFGCTYCYASFMGRFVGKTTNDWGDYVHVKINAPELLKEDLRKLRNKGKGKSILFSSVTDPYQGVEAKYQLTRRCLEVLVDYGFEGTLSILTKSHMVTRDVDLLKKLKDVEVGFTITSTDDRISRYFEKKAPNVSQRFEAMRELNTKNIRTYAFVGPLLPHYAAEPTILDELFGRIAKTGTKELYVEHINLSKYILDRLKKEMPSMDKETMERFYSSRKAEYRDELNKIVLDLVKKHELKLRLDSAIYHTAWKD
jgi:DNA repair photolyase